MTTRFQPPPTWELPIVMDQHQTPVFSTIWLNWFLDLSANLDASGVVDPAGTQTVLPAQIFSSKEPTDLAQEAFRSNGSIVFNARLFNHVPSAVFPTEAILADQQNILANQIFGS